MGIRGLNYSVLPQPKYLKSSGLSGKRVAVDGLCWICNYVGPNRYLSQTNPKDIAEYVVKNVKCLRAVGLAVKLVFDGAFLRSWQNYCEPAKKRNRRYFTSKYFDEKKLPDIVYDIIEDLAILIEKDDGVSYMVAPNESDAQLAYFATRGLVDIIITNDTDLIAYGCPRIFYKLNMETWYGVDIDREALMNDLAPGLTDSQILQAMLLTGCDYVGRLSAFPSLGLPTGHLPIRTTVKLIRQFGNYWELIKSVDVTDHARMKFEHALYTFRHHRVYIESEKKFDYLNPIDSDEMCQNCAWFLGNGKVDPVITTGIISGYRYPYPPYNILRKAAAAGVDDKGIQPSKKQKIMGSGG